MEFMRFGEPLCKGFWGDEEVMFENILLKAPKSPKQKQVNTSFENILLKAPKGNHVDTSFTVVLKKNKSTKTIKTYIGIVKSWKLDKGYGFIELSSGKILGKDTVFCHQSHIKKNGFRFLERGQRVQFQVLEKPNNKIEAIHVLEF